MSYLLNQSQLQAFLETEFPQIEGQLSVDLKPDGVEMVLHPQESHLRPGGTISGPTMFMLGDVAFYMELMARIGPKALAVTTSASIDFMRKPEAGGQLVAKPRLLKLGRVLAVGDVLIYPAGQSDGASKPVAHANFTYSIPPQRG